MEKIAILSHVNRSNGGFNFLFPIFRWEKDLHEDGMHFDIIADHNDKRILNYKTVIVVHRYFEKMINKGIIKDHEPIKEFLNKLRNSGAKVIFFDAGDSTGSWFFDLMDYVDLFLKKQLLSDRHRYLDNHGAKSVRVWMTESGGSEVRVYHPCKLENIHKLQLAWNIGLVDFRYNPLNFGLLSNRLFTKLKTSDPLTNRKILTSYRGKIHSHNAHSFQRNELIKILERTTLPVITGAPIQRSKYLKELENCKAMVSPYGWGEICYRDFEVFISGAILIKPDMTHLETFPNFYDITATYLPVNWKMTDLEEKIGLVNDKYDDFVDIARFGQKNFVEHYNDGAGFVTHIRKMLSL